jgi:antitoxin YefM
MIHATVSEVRSNFKSFLDKVNDDVEEVYIIRERGSNAVLVSEGEWESIQETLRVYEDPETLASLRRSLQQMQEGAVIEFASLDEVFEGIEL